MTHPRLQGLVAATHTPFDSSGALKLAAVEHLAEHLLRTGVDAVFIGGTTGERHSLTFEERVVLAQRWAVVGSGSALRLHCRQHGWERHRTLPLRRG